MQLSNSPAKTRASFNDPNLVSHAGLVPVMGLAQHARLGDLAKCSAGAYAAEVRHAGGVIQAEAVNLTDSNVPV